jgi:hypothetical protein
MPPESVFLARGRSEKSFQKCDLGNDIFTNASRFCGLGNRRFNSYSVKLYFRKWEVQFMFPDFYRNA